MSGKPRALLLLWALALLISAGLRRWGALHPGSPIVDGPTVVWLVFGPAVLVVIWLLVGLTGGERESDDCDQESH